MLATKDDIRACFRLLLGREPNPEEWPGHSSRAGQPLRDIVRSFLSSKECQSRNLFEAAKDDDIEIVDVNGMALAVRRGDIDVGRSVLKGDYELHVTALFKRELKSRMRAIDVGANCGYFTSLALSLVGTLGHVWAIEPNADNVRLLEIARRRNNASNLTILAAAAGEGFGAACVYAAHSNGMVGPLSASATMDKVAAQVTLDGLTHDNRVDFVKIDVEGFEGRVLRGARRLLGNQRPSIVLEFAPTGLDGMTGMDLLEMLRGFGYVIGVIMPDGEADYLDNASIMDRFGVAPIDHLDLFATHPASS